MRSLNLCSIYDIEIYPSGKIRFRPYEAITMHQDGTDRRKKVETDTTIRIRDNRNVQHV